jgi:hypothetical protein
MVLTGTGVCSTCCTRVLISGGNNIAFMRTTVGDGNFIGNVFVRLTLGCSVADDQAMMLIGFGGVDRQQASEP